MPVQIGQPSRILRSVFSPGMFFTNAAFANVNSNRPAKMAQIGFQYTPVDSITTERTPSCSNQSANSNKLAVMVPNSRFFRIGSVPSPTNTHTLTLFL